MNETPNEATAHSSLRWLKTLVITLTITMIIGFITIVILFIIKFQEMSSPVQLTVPESITLPKGNSSQAFIQGNDFYLVVTNADEIIIYDMEGHNIIKRIPVH